MRQLSREIVVNPNTVARAYTELERDGTLITQQGRGVFVAKPHTNLTKKARRKQLFEQFDLLFVEAVHLGFTSEELLDMVQSRIDQFEFVPEIVETAKTSVTVQWPKGPGLARLGGCAGARAVDWTRHRGPPRLFGIADPNYPPQGPHDSV